MLEIYFLSLSLSLKVRGGGVGSYFQKVTPLIWSVESILIRKDKSSLAVVLGYIIAESGFAVV
jgi:hypothetical protein